MYERQIRAIQRTARAGRALPNGRRISYSGRSASQGSNGHLKNKAASYGNLCGAAKPYCDLQEGRVVACPSVV